MGEKQCGKCGEMVDEAKAFCPGCGNAFVEEKTRTSVSDFDMSDSTVRLGDTMYNQMLADMGLSVSKQPNREEKRIEPILPAASPTVVSKPEQRQESSVTQPVDRGPIVITIVVIAFAVVAAIVIVATVLYFS